MYELINALEFQYRPTEVRHRLHTSTVPADKYAVEFRASWFDFLALKDNGGKDLNSTDFKLWFEITFFILDFDFKSPFTKCFVISIWNHFLNWFYNFLKSHFDKLSADQVSSVLQSVI
jgi:hypothetical protein